jgi:hypothetical protein
LRIRHKLVLNKRRFKSFRKQWDGQASEDASEEFEDKLQKQDRVALQTVLEDDIMKMGSESADEEKSEEQEMEITEFDGGDDELPCPRTLTAPSAPSSCRPYQYSVMASPSSEGSLRSHPLVSLTQPLNHQQLAQHHAHHPPSNMISQGQV